MSSSTPSPPLGGFNSFNDQTPRRWPRVSRRTLILSSLALLAFLYFLVLEPYAHHSSPTATLVQRQAYIRTRRHRRVECPARVGDRYDGLKGGRKVFVAINLYQSEEVVAMFFQELPKVVEALGGGQNVYVSVYENGSEDATQEMLGLFDKLLKALNVPHTIVSKGASSRSDKDAGKRILVLADARNRALTPLYDGTARAALSSSLPPSPPSDPDEVLFINDVFFCASDILEVVLQKRRQGMHQACAFDWDPGQIAYDRWVLRSMSGRNWYRTDDLVDWFNGPDDHPKTVPEPLLDDVADRRRYDAGLPVQVFSCWNGATVIDAAAFLPPHNIRFRQSLSDPDENLGGATKNATMRASECFLSSVDLWKAGMGRIGIVPSASVAYTADLYDRWRKDVKEPGEDVAPYEWINWRKDPPRQIAFQDYAWWWAPDRWGAWDEQ